MIGAKIPRERFSELSYSNDNQPRLKRWLIRLVEGLSGRSRYAALYDAWRQEVLSGSGRSFARALELIGVDLVHKGTWPPEQLPDTPLVMIANHPFGIGDGLAILSLAEQLDRPFRVMLAADLMKVPEILPYSLPVDFTETKEALKNNLAVRHEAIRLLKEGVTVVIFPAGGVATAPKVLGRAQDLPWKVFVARLVQDAKASVIPIHFEGQNGRLFHLVSVHEPRRQRAQPRPLRRKPVADAEALAARARVRPALRKTGPCAHRAGAALVDAGAPARSKTPAGAAAGGSPRSSAAREVAKAACHAQVEATIGQFGSQNPSGLEVRSDHSRFEVERGYRPAQSAPSVAVGAVSSASTSTSWLWPAATVKSFW